MKIIGLLRVFRAFVVCASFVEILSSPCVAWALPRPGEQLPNVRLVDTYGKSLELRQLRGRPVLIFYENKQSSKQNIPLKRELSKLVNADPFVKKVISLVPVASAEGYDFWPARGFVIDAIRKEQVKVGAPIYCDWTGYVGKALSIDARASNVVYLNREGRVVFVRQGPMGPSERGRLIELLQAEVRKARGSR
jgi:hypothetical protein